MKKVGKPVMAPEKKMPGKGKVQSSMKPGKYVKAGKK